MSKDDIFSDDRQFNQIKAIEHLEISKSYNPYSFHIYYLLGYINALIN